MVAACIAPWATSEIVMSRLLYADLEPEDVVLAHLAYGSYVDLALVKQQGEGWSVPQTPCSSH